MLWCGSACALSAGPSAWNGGRTSPLGSAVELLPPATGGKPSPTGPTSPTGPAGSPGSSAGNVPSTGDVPSASASAVPRRFVVLGDSLSAWTFPPGSTTPSTFGAWPSLLATEDPGLVLSNNAGVPGNTTAQMLARLQGDVLDYDPDLLFVLGGTNDIGHDLPASVVVANLRQITGTAEGHGITVVLLTIPPANDQTEPRRQARRDINAQLGNLARQEGILLVDVFSVLAAPDDNLADGYAAYDGLHLSQRGEQALADAVYRALQSK